MRAPPDSPPGEEGEYGRVKREGRLTLRGLAYGRPPTPSPSQAYGGSSRSAPGWDLSVTSSYGRSTRSCEEEEGRENSGYRRRLASLDFRAMLFVLGPDGPTSPSLGGTVKTECDGCGTRITIATVDADGVLVGDECPKCGYYTTRYMPGQEPK